jgi:hypothetical protein
LAGGADSEDSGLVHSRQLHIHGRSQPLRADVVEEIGQDGSGTGFLGSVPDAAGLPNRIMNSFSATIEYGRSVSSMIAFGLGEFVQYAALLFFPSPCVGGLGLSRVPAVGPAYEKTHFEQHCLMSLRTCHSHAFPWITYCARLNFPTSQVGLLTFSVTCAIIGLVGPLYHRITRPWDRSASQIGSA